MLDVALCRLTMTGVNDSLEVIALVLEQDGRDVRTAGAVPIR